MSQHVGVDIGSYGVKAACVDHGRGGGMQLVNLKEEYNPVGQVLPSDPVLVKKLAAVVKKLFDEGKFPKSAVSMCLPESMAYTSVINMPYLSEAELASSIHWEAEQHIPVSLNEVNLEYEVLYKPPKAELGEKMRVLLVAARKDIVEKAVELFEMVGIDLLGMETVLLSVHRSLHQTLEQVPGAAVVVHMGAVSTEILVVEHGTLSLTYTVPTGGLALTRALEKGLELPPSQAEEYKRAYGLNGSQLEGRVRQVLVPVMNIVAGEVRKAIQYYQSVQDRQPIRVLFLSGGSAYLPDASSFLAEALSNEVVVAQPSQGIEVVSGLTLPQNLAAYTPAIGLAMKP